MLPPRFALTAFVALVGLPFSSAAAQTWSRQCPLEGGAHVSSDSAGGALFVVDQHDGPGHVAHIDAAGDVLWSRFRHASFFRLEGVLALADSSAWVYGFSQYTPTALAAERFDATGQNVESIVVEVDAEDGWIRSMIPTADGGIAFVGRIWSDVASAYGGVVVRYAADGTEVFARHVRRANPGAARLVFHDVAELPDGTLLVTGDMLHTAGEASWTMFVARIGLGGQLMWARYGDQYSLGSETLSFVSPAGNGDALVAWAVADQVIWTVLARIDADGNLLWSRRVDGFMPQAEVASPTGSWVLAGAAFEGGELGDNDAAVLELNPATGEWLRGRSWGIAGDDRFTSVDVRASGELLLGGYARKGFGPGLEAFAMQLDPSWSGVPCAGVEIEPQSAPLALTLPEYTSLVEGPAVALRASIGDSPEDSDLPWLPGCYGWLGTPYCSPAVQNSTGVPGALTVKGSDSTAAEFVRLRAKDLPANQFGYFLVGAGSQIVQPPGSQGPLCLDGATIGRYVSPIESTGSQGQFSRAIDVTDVPAYGSISPGDTFGFQAWYRDKNPTPTSNFTDSVRVTFR